MTDDDVKAVAQAIAAANGSPHVDDWLIDARAAMAATAEITAFIGAKPAAENA